MTIPGTNYEVIFDLAQKLEGEIVPASVDECYQALDFNQFRPPRELS